MNRLKTGLKILISLAILYFVFTKVNSSELLSLLKNLKIFPLLAALISFIASQYVSSLRLNRFWRDIGLQLPQTYNWKLYLLGMYYNLLLPGGIGGDGYKMFLLSKENGFSKKKLLEALLMDRINGLLALLILLCLGISWVDPFTYSRYFVFLIIPGVFIFVLISRQWFSHYVKSLPFSLILSLGIQILQLISAFFILLSLGINTGFLAYLSVFLLSSIAAVIPITFGGAGARELTFLYSADFLDIEVNTAIALSLIFYVITVLVSLAGIYYSFKQKIK